MVTVVAVVVLIVILSAPKVGDWLMRSIDAPRRPTGFEHSPYADHRRPDRDQVMPTRHVCDDSLEHATGRSAVEHAAMQALGQLPYDQDQDKDTK